MELQTSQVDIESIEVRQDFPAPDAEQVAYLAHAISLVGGLIQVPIVKQLDLETYELVHGFFEYQAYLKAREINPELPDRMRVFIITKKNEAPIQQQIKVFETLSGDSNGGGANPQMAIRLNNLASTLELLQKDVRSTAVASQQAILEAIDERIPKPLPPLEAFNRIREPQVAKEVQSKLAALGNKKSQKIIELLQNYQKKNPEKPFTSFSDVLGALGKGVLSKEKMLDVIDSW